MLSSKRACLTSFECEPILNEGSHPVQHLEDVTSDSDDSISLEETGPVEALLATCCAESDLRILSEFICS